MGTGHAISATTGQTLWKHKRRVATMALVATGGGLAFTCALDGRQYAAVSTGTGCYQDLTPELRPSLGHNLFLFVLPWGRTFLKPTPQDARRRTS